MFRESDYVEPQLHPSYANKPRPIFQVEAQLSQFDGKTVSRETYNGRQEMPPQVPTSYDTVVDPSHPDADWTGLVSKDRVHQKKHSSTHRSLQTGICQTEEGIVSLNEKSEWNHLRRNSNPAVRGHSDLIGGIDTQEHFQTTSQRQMNGVKTSQDQLTLVKRAGHRKPIQDPAQATPEIRYGQSSMVAGGSESGGYGGGEYGRGGGYGYRPQAIGGSLIKNIGSSLASRVEPLPSHSSGSSHGSGSTSKTLVVENFNSTPGYTGRRRIV